jgi:hypothetical protein
MWLEASMTEARDIRFRGTDPRLLRIAEALELDVAGLDTHSLPGAVAEAVEARGLPHTPDVPGLFAELLRNDEKAKQSRRKPKATSDKRGRLELLRNELDLWLSDEQAPGVRIVPRYLALDDKGNLIQGAEELERVEPLAQRIAAALCKESDTVEKWLYDNHEAVAMLAIFRPVRLPD